MTSEIGGDLAETDSCNSLAPAILDGRLVPGLTSALPQRDRFPGAKFWPLTGRSQALVHAQSFVYAIFSR